MSTVCVILRYSEMANADPLTFTDIVRLLFMVPIYSIVTLAAYVFYVSPPISQ